jgi:hypothetical protein
MEKEECCRGRREFEKCLLSFSKIQEKKFERKVHNKLVHFFVFYSEEMWNGY